MERRGLGKISGDAIRRRIRNWRHTAQHISTALRRITGERQPSYRTFATGWRRRWRCGWLAPAPAPALAPAIAHRQRRTSQIAKAKNVETDAGEIRSQFRLSPPRSALHITQPAIATTRCTEGFFCSSPLSSVCPPCVTAIQTWSGRTGQHESHNRWSYETR